MEIEQERLLNSEVELSSAGKVKSDPFVEYTRKWFKYRPGLNVRWVERECGFSRGTISLFLLEERGFPVKHREKLVSVISKLGFVLKASPSRS